MRRIAGTIFILATFSGCNMPQARYTQNDRPPMYSEGSMAASASAWPRTSPSQFPAEPPPNGPSSPGGAASFVTAQEPQLPNTGATQTAAKQPYNQSFPTGVASGAAPIPAIADLASAGGLAQASYSTAVDPVLIEATKSGDPMKLDAVPPSRLPQIVASPLPLLPEIVMEPKPVPVSVALDMHSSPSSAPALRLVNTKRFTLSYAVQDLGTGVAGIDLWETRDSKTWKKCDSAVAHNNAYHVEVKEEGVFGYTMVARPVGDKGVTQPKAGDVPQVWVTVDATKPAVSLTGVELNLTSKIPNLIVRWSAQDKNFGPRPVTLTYSEHAEGPWLPLAANIENSGHYECAIPANMPKRALLRIEAIDLVGNVGTAQTAKSVRLDFGTTPVANVLPPPPQVIQTVAVEMPRPTVTISDVESSDNTKE